MEAEGRPKKLRKLRNGVANDARITAEEDVSHKVPHSQIDVETHEGKTIHQTSAAADATETNEPKALISEISASEDHEEPGTPEDQSTSALPLSKNALKKIRNKERWDAGRDARKLKRKQKIAEKRIRKRAAKEEAEAAAAAAAAEDEANRKGSEAVTLRDTSQVQEVLIDAETLPDKPKRPLHTHLPVTIVIDCGFDNLMTEREMISLGSQLTRSYSDNHKAPYQAHMFVSSWGGQLKRRFETVLEKHHENWKGVTFMEEDFVEAANKAKELMKGKTGCKLAGAFAAGNNHSVEAANGSEPKGGMMKDREGASTGKEIQVENPQLVVTASQEEHAVAEKPASATEQDLEELENRTNVEPKLFVNGHSKDLKEAAVDEHVQVPEVEAGREGDTIYLTSDSPHTLDRLQPYSTYIVGGLVDKNRHKGICYQTACDRGIKTAKLPIGEFMEMQSRFVLATNHVVEIMVRWLECGDWAESFVRVMPKRKGGVLKAAYGIKQDVHGNGLGVDVGESISGSANWKETAENLKPDGVKSDTRPTAGVHTV